ncbi:peptidoglycan-binding domain-containing protein [Streptomyces sp. HNM0663]|uniref:Peptidoglycan-binding domain-containing protein n=1 Tax=Streptomyces chengmaiensis TaxID=3040919 RepID=A0ABT6HLM4_9ACTN|nr:peptidoglycan-binding domain-containing protein [Streptomyces chengmaiensis]MDH2389622.1 peptidoglycan-binding domain-containing protein [Streptomyces chengmaiensis]
MTNDWGDEGLLSTTSYNHSNLAGWWQQILYSDGYLEAGSQDCWFGPKTEAATKAWQRDHGLVADGIVGPNTWGKADDKLYWNSSRGYIQYRGDKYTRGPIYRDSQGRYYAYYEGAAYYVSYTVANVPTCS